MKCAKYFGTPSSKFKYSVSLNITLIMSEHLVHVEILYQNLIYRQHNLETNLKHKASLFVSGPVYTDFHLIVSTICKKVVSSLPPFLWIKETETLKI